MDGWQPNSPDMSDFDAKIWSARSKQPPKITLTSTGYQLLDEARQQAMRQNLASLPSVEQGLARAMKNELDRAKLQALYDDVHGDKPKPKADTRPRITAAKNVPAKVVRQARARQIAKPKLSVAEQRVIVAAMRSEGILAGARAVVAAGLRPSGDLTGPAFRRIGTRGYHR